MGAERFIREIRVAARLTHPHIVPLLDSGSVDGAPYYVMPFIDGESLRARLNRGERVPLDDAIALIAEVADALEYAHAAGIIHRDIKPENILLLRGHAVVADFGIARALRRATELANGTTTTGGIVLGTPAYMSPEQPVGETEIDGRSDVYSLAIVFFEMVSGTLPFAASTTQGLIAKRFVERAPVLSSRVAGIPAFVDQAVSAALALEPVDRPAGAIAFARLLGGAKVVAVATPTTPVAAAATSAHRTGAVTTRTLGIITDPTLPSVAVLPLSNLSADPENEFLSDGITEEIISTLSRLRTIRVAARASPFAFKDGIGRARAMRFDERRRSARARPPRGNGEPSTTTCRRLVSTKRGLPSTAPAHSIRCRWRLRRASASCITWLATARVRCAR